MKNPIRIIALLIVALTTLNAYPQAFTIKNKSAISHFNDARRAMNPEHQLEYIDLALKKEKRFVEAYWLKAEIYLHIKQIDNAIATLEKADELQLPDPGETRCRLAELYFRTGKYERALDKINEIVEYNYITRRDKLKAKYEFALNLYNNPTDFAPRNLAKVNTVYDDYFPSVTADGQYISTTVLLPAVALFLEPELKRYQEDIYVSHWEVDDWGYSEPLDGPLNTQGNEGSQSFSADGRYMFYVQCDNKANIGSCDIYYSIRRGDVWTPPINLGEPANSQYWESNPSLSASGNKLYFTSRRPGGLGETDIWCVDVGIDRDGLLTTSNARPLGAPVNTEKSEFAPFIHADNRTLYFASDGHNGMGGSDIFVSRLGDDGRWSKPKNIGYPVNTYGEESGFVVNGLGDRAYFASDNIENDVSEDNEDNPRSGLDIYEIMLPQELRPDPIVYSPGRVYNAATGRPLETMVEIFDQRTNSQLFKSLSDGKDGSFTALLPQGGIYGLSVTNPGFLYYTAAISTPGDSILVALQPIKSGSRTTLNNLFFDYDSDKILATSYAEIARLTQFLYDNPKVNINIVGHTDNQGNAKYNLDLSNRRANSLRNALIQYGVAESRMTAEGKGSTQPIATNETEEGRAQNRRVEVIIK